MRAKKERQKKEEEKLMFCLRRWEYPQDSTVRKIGSSSCRLTASDVQSIITFLFRRMDPNFSVPPTPPGRFGEEVSMVFKAMGYDIHISKFTNPGSDFNWPVVLSAIDWLVGNLILSDGENWEEEEDRLMLTFDDTANWVEKQFYKFLRESMVAFLKGDRAKCEELEAMLLDTYSQDSGKLGQYFTGLNDACSKMRNEIEAMNEEVNK